MILAALLLVPLIAGCGSFFAGRRQTREAFNIGGFAILFVLALALAGQVVRTGPVSLWNGFLYADALSALVILLASSVALLCGIYAVGYLREDERSEAFAPAAADDKIRKYYTLTPLLVFSMLLVTVSNNLGVMWVAIEATTLASVFLVTLYGKPTSLEAAWKYAILGGVGLSMALFGTVLTYYSGHRLPGSETLAGLNWSALVLRAQQLDATTMRLGFILALLGYGTKVGLAPMHTWKPDAYSEAPVPAAAILSTALMNCAIYALIRFYVLASRCLGPDFPGALLLLFGMLSMGVAVPFILVQRNFRRLLAYSSVEHAGIMAAALGIGGAFGTLGLMLHMVFHTIAKALLFFCAGNVFQNFKTDLFRKIGGGLIRTMPVTGPVLLMGMVAILGLPPFSLFQSEFLIVRAAFDGGHYVPIVLFILFGTAIFAGAAVHVGGMMLGSAAEVEDTGDKIRDGRTVAGVAAWHHGSILLLASVLAVIGFWMPPPLFALIRGAAGVISGGAH